MSDETYGGITRSKDKPFWSMPSEAGGSITVEMIQNFFSPERLERERQAEWEMRREQAEMMKPYRDAPPNVVAAAYRVMLSNFGTPLHPKEAEALRGIIEAWKPERQQENG